MKHRSLENSIREIMAAQSQSTPLEESVEETVEVQESETFADNSVDLDEAMSPEAKAAKKHIEDLAKKNNKSFGDQRMHIDDFPGKHDRKTQAAAKALNKHQYGEEVEQVDEVDKGFGQRMKAADAAANIYSKEKRKPDNREIDKIRAKYRDQKKNQSQSEEARKVNELSKSTLGSYVKKASQSAADHGAETGRKQSDRDSVQRSLNRHGMSDAEIGSSDAKIIAFDTISESC